MTKLAAFIMLLTAIGLGGLSLMFALAAREAVLYAGAILSRD